MLDRNDSVSVETKKVSEGNASHAFIPVVGAQGAVTAIVLAGGAATRMGGADKGLIEMNGRPFVAHVLERIRPQCAHVVISANRNQERYAAFGHPVVADETEGFQGPLAGIAAALAVIKTPLAVVVPCDSPYLAADYVQRLAAPFLEQRGVCASAARAEGREQPVFMMIQTNLRESLLAYLSQGGRRVRAWLESAGVVWVDFPDIKAFDNLNTPQDVARAERLDKAH